MDLNLKKLKKRLKFKLDKLLGKTYFGHRNKKIVFVLSTGRCGSTSIVKMFNQHPQFLAFHEDIPELIQLSTKLAENPSAKKEIYKELDLIFRNKIWEGPSDKIHVHSDHRLWNLVEFLSDYFPNSIFIHLIRNPYDSIKSFLPRNWYANDLGENINSNIYEKYRLRGNRVGAFTDSEWQRLSNTEKCAWYWNFVNESIAEQLKHLKRTNYQSLLINLEEMTAQMNSRVKPFFGMADTFVFENVVSNQTPEEKVSGEFYPEIENALQRFATAKAEFYPYLNANR